MTVNVPITSRAAWGANPLVTPAATIHTPTPELWLHHSAGEQFGAAGMRMLQSFTLHRGDGYVDLEYTFVVDHQSLEVFESRGPGHDTAATYLHNSQSHAVCCMGNFQNDAPSPQLLDRLAQIAVMGYQHGWWAYPRYTGGHRDASGNSTACPGDHLEAQIGNINARAAHLLEPVPKPEVVKVQPQYNPPRIVAPWVSSLANYVDGNGGGWLAFEDGAISPVFGAPPLAGMNGKPAFAGRHTAQLVKPNTKVAGSNPPLPNEAQGLAVIVATSGERYVVGA